MGSKVGKYWSALCILDVTADYLIKEVPEKNIELGQSKTVYVDGKDWPISPKTSDTVFFRVGDESILNEKIPYWIIPFLPHGYALAHGEANLCRPLRYPGRYAIVGKDYWEDKVNYTRIQQPSTPPRNVELSSRRKCLQCKQGQLTWYLPNRDCSIVIALKYWYKRELCWREKLYAFDDSVHVHGGYPTYNTGY